MATKARGTMPLSPQMSWTNWGVLGKDLGVCTHAVAHAQRHRDDGQGAGSHFSLVMSWMPDTTMEENIMTAALPRTACGMMEMSAPSFGDEAAETSGRWHRWPVRLG